MHKKKEGFTLVELIVVIAILAILGTIAFITLQGYAREARNSARASDLATIRSSLSFFSTEKSRYPRPDNYIDVGYSGSTLWRQGIFGQGVRRELGKFSKPVVDPTLQTEFDYGVVATKSDYQIATVYELAYDTIPGIENTYALDDSGFNTYIEGTYDSFDLNAFSGSTCSLITVPSLLLGNIPVGGNLVVGDTYGFAYNKGPNIANNALTAVDTVTGNIPFVLSKVYDRCTVDDIGDIDLYIATLSTAYQQYADGEVFEKIVFTSDTKAFRARMGILLNENRITISPNLLNALKNPAPDIVFDDTFGGSNGTNLSDHTTLLGSWIMESGADTSYQIQSNAIRKTDNSMSLVRPVPAPAMTSNSYKVSFDVNNFGGGSVYSYLRYLDSANSYGLEVYAGGFRLFHIDGGVRTNIQNIAETFTTPTRIIFEIDGDNVTSTIGGVPRGTTAITGISDIGRPVLYLENNGAIIDNYKLTYQ